MNNDHVLIVGLGEVGSALAEVLERKYSVSRLDLQPAEITEPVGIMHLCFPYYTADQFIEAAAAYIDHFTPDLTIVNSTVLPGTVRMIATRTRTPIAYSPIRGKHARMSQELLHYTKFVAAPNSRTCEAAEHHFHTVGMRTQRIPRVESLELAKLGETTYFGLLIAFAQELNRFASSAGAEYEESIKLFEEVPFLPNVPYYPGFIGGHCVIPNINLLKSLRASQLLDAVLDSNNRRAIELGIGTATARSSSDPQLTHSSTGSAVK